MEERILLVEDDPFILESVTMLLSEEHYVVCTADTLEKAEYLLKSRPLDAIILDVLLPDGSGFDFCAKIRTYSKIPLLFLTCCDTDEDMVRGLGGGGDDYVTKPFRANVLLSRVRALLRRSRSYDCRITLPYLRFIPERQSCLLGERPIPLTPLEYRLLYTIAKYAPEIVSRDTLLSEIWEWVGDFSDENLLSVHISRIRGKMGAYSRYLTTVRGQGYRLETERTGGAV